VLRMLTKFVGEDKFLKGVSLYLKKHLYSNTVSRNLWEGIGEATGKKSSWSFCCYRLRTLAGVDIPKIMDNWVTKVGDRAITAIIHTSAAHRWDSRCSPLPRPQLASKCVRIASSKMGKSSQRTTRQFGEHLVLAYAVDLTTIVSLQVCATGVGHCNSRWTVTGR